MVFFPTLWGLALIATAFSLASLFIIKRFANPIHVRRHHQLIDSTLNVVGTLFSILLGLLVAGALTRYQEITAEVSAEARSLAEIYHLSNGLPTQKRLTIQKLCTEYCDVIIEKEWPEMELGHLPQIGRMICGELAEQIICFKPTDEGESNIHNAMLTSAEGLGKGRRDRAEALRSGMHNTAITIFVSSGIILILTCLYVTRGILLHTVMTIFIATCLALNIGLLHMLATPFHSELQIKPTGFLLDRQIFQELAQKNGGRLTKEDVKSR